MNMSWRIVIFGSCLLALARSAGAADAPWNMTQERYSCYTSGMTLQELASGGVTVLSHTPHTRQYCEEARKWGIKACPYVSLYKVLVSDKAAAEEDELKSPFWKEVDASKHPAWFLRREDGQIRRPFDNPDYGLDNEQSCCNHRDLMAAYERGVRNLMEIGAGGVFVDNVHPYPECFGAKLGIHTHDWPKKNNVECYKMALRRVYNAVKSYGADRPVILNTGGRNDEYAPFGDCQMWESFGWRSPVAGDKAPMVDARRCGSWKEFSDAYRRRSQGKHTVSITALTYLPDPATESENAFFAYAAARLVGFEQWTATCVKRRDILRRLYRVATGRATSEIVEAGGAAYRQFQNALIVCNHSKQVVEVRVPLPPALRTAAVELLAIRELPIVDGHVALSLPAESGRVIVARADAIDNLLREVEGQALAARLHVEEKPAGRNDSNTTALQKQLQDIESQAIALRKNVREGAFPTDADRETLAKLSKDAAAVQTPSRSDPFLSERLSNLHIHANVAAGLIAH
jgi:hypothetical protein